MVMRTIKTLIVFFAAVICIGTCYSHNELRFYSAVDGFAPALKIGIEKPLNERLSLKTSAGFCIFGLELFSYNLFASYRVTKTSKPTGIDINLGFLDNYKVFGQKEFIIGLGGGMGISHRFKNYSALAFRVGLIYGPHFHDKTTDYNVLPNFGIEYSIPFKIKNS